jgi:cold shock CspA family protein
VRLEVRVPGAELAVTDKPGDITTHADIYSAVRDAFKAMERQLKKWKQKKVGEVKAHEAPLQGRIAELHADKGYGQIAATDGRLVYFHKNSLVSGTFDELAEGDTVELVVQSGESPVGPQASTVRPIGSLEFVEDRKHKGAERAK